MTTPSPTTLILRHMTENDHAPAAALGVTSDQMQFVDSMPLTLKTTALKRDNFVIEAYAGIVGFSRSIPGFRITFSSHCWNYARW